MRVDGKRDDFVVAEFDFGPLGVALVGGGANGPLSQVAPLFSHLGVAVCPLPSSAPVPYTQVSLHLGRPASGHIIDFISVSPVLCFPSSLEVSTGPLERRSSQIFEP